MVEGNQQHVEEAGYWLSPVNDANGAT